MAQVSDRLRAVFDFRGRGDGFGRCGGDGCCGGRDSAADPGGDDVAAGGREAAPVAGVVVEIDFADVAETVGCAVGEAVGFALMGLVKTGIMGGNVLTGMPGKTISQSVRFLSLKSGERIVWIQKDPFLFD